MIISPESFRNIKKRDYFPLFLSEYFNQHIYNDRFLAVRKKCGFNVKVTNIICGILNWRSSSQGWTYWNDKYNSEIMREFETAHK